MIARANRPFASFALLLVLAPPASAAGNAPGVVAPPLRCDQPRAPRLASPPASAASPACCVALAERVQALEDLVGAPVAPASHAVALSAGTVIVANCSPPTLVPGLEMEIEVAEGSSLLVTLDARSHRSCLSDPHSHNGVGHLFQLEIDGTVVASRFVDKEDDNNDGQRGVAVAVHGLSVPLPAGPHVVRAVIVTGVDTDANGNLWPCRPYSTLCFGSVSPGDGLEARLIAVELR